MNKENNKKEIKKKKKKKIKNLPGKIFATSMLILMIASILVTALSYIS